MFANAKLIKFTTENMHSEIKIHAQSLRKSLEAVTGDGLVLNDLEVSYVLFLLQLLGKSILAKQVLCGFLNIVVNSCTPYNIMQVSWFCCHHYL